MTTSTTAVLYLYTCLYDALLILNVHSHVTAAKTENLVRKFEKTVTVWRETENYPDKN